MSMGIIQSRFRKLTVVLALSVGLLGVCAASSLASPALKAWVEMPTTARAGESIAVHLTIQNVGNSPTQGPLVLSDTVGTGLSSPEAEFVQSQLSASSNENHPSEAVPSCQAVGSTVTCEVPWEITPGGQLHTSIIAEIEGSPPSVGDILNVSGGGVAGQTSMEETTIVGPPEPFGFASSAVELLNADGSPSVQAGSDPATFTTKLYFRTFASKAFGIFDATSSVEHFKDVTASLPVGFIGNPLSTPAVCTAAQLATGDPNSDKGTGVRCPPDSQVGVARVLGGLGNQQVALYSMVAPPGAATELGFNDMGVVIILDAYVRPSDYGIDIVSRDTSTSVPINAVEITTWGVPADSSHDPYRGLCIASGFLEGPNGLDCPTTVPRKAFLRMPTSCSGRPLQFAANANSYEELDHYAETSFTGPTLSGCEVVPFSPEISVFPTGTAANSPTGLSVRLSLPQNANPDGLAEADLKKAVVTLPEGMTINPSAADGLQACTDAQLRLGQAGPAECPDGSKIGTVLLHTPLLAEPVEGDVYVLTQNSSDPESGQMFRIGMELRNDQRGIDIKVPGQISVNKTTGRLTTTFDNNPQLPFSDVTLSFKAGARAPLVTPASCLAQTTEADLYSWAQPGVPVRRSNSFNLTVGPEGLACMSQEPFNPGFDAGVQSVQAGGFTPFLATFSRKDSDQSMQRVSVKMPQGLLGSLVGLPLCGEAQANAGTCSQTSEIGSVTAGAGAGPTPFYVTGGKVFMTGPYEGAPFGLSVVVPAKAGPFDLGLVVVRAKLEVDIHTAQLTVTTDPLPQIVGGVPVNLRLVNVTINRPNFTYNPTSCNPSEVTGTMTGGQGAVANVSNHFQVTNCGALKFQPHFTVFASGKTSRADGASLDAKLTYPTTAQGVEANIAKVKVDLPKKLPSRLTTLQKACDAATFEANPAACPTASRVGTARAVTPVLPVPLTGPVYFVSHGGEAWPDLVVVLQGYGVTVNLVGTTFISKKGITSTTFQQVPDVPVGEFELKLPQGPNGALAANGNLCAATRTITVRKKGTIKSKGKRHRVTRKVKKSVPAGLEMPTAFVAQDGAEIHQNTPIAVTGCVRHKTVKKAGKHHKHTKGKKK